MNHSDVGLGILIGVITVVVMGMASEKAREHKAKEPEAKELKCPGADTIPPPYCRNF